jgi:RHS repeat-associated protein
LREANIGWYLLGNGYRAYNPRLMRFHSPDSWSPFGRGGLNPYMYCVGDPVNRSDPTGHVSPFNRMTGFFKTLGPGKSRPVDLNKLDLSGAREIIGKAHNERINYVAPPAGSSGIGAILYNLGTSNRMAGGSPAISDIGPTTARHHPGYAAGAAMSGLTHRSTRPTPQASSLSGGHRNVPRSDAPPKYEPPPSYGESMPLSNADTFARSQQDRSFVVNRVSDPNSGYLDLRAPRMEHPTLPQPPTPPRSRSPSTSPPSSRDSTPPRSRNNSGGNNALNFDDLATGLRFIRRQ